MHFIAPVMKARREKQLMSLCNAGIPLKVMQSVALATVWRQGQGKELLLPLGLFGTHLFLGNW